MDQQLMDMAEDRMIITSLDRIAETQQLRNALATFRAAGFAVVPVKPTKEMIGAGLASGPNADEIWNRMVEAAPDFT